MDSRECAVRVSASSFHTLSRKIPKHEWISHLVPRVGTHCTREDGELEGVRDKIAITLRNWLREQLQRCNEGGHYEGVRHRMIIPLPPSPSDMFGRIMQCID